MNFNLHRPCANCPFRTDCPRGWLGETRAQGIAHVLQHDGSFACHKTVEWSDDEAVRREEEQFCAGAMLLMQRTEPGGTRANVITRAAEGFFGFDPSHLDASASVFANWDEFVAHHAGSIA